MSASQVIEQIRQLPHSEQERVFTFVEGERTKVAGNERQATNAVFEKAAEKIFRENENLFRRLSQ